MTPTCSRVLLPIVAQTGADYNPDLLHPGRLAKLPKTQIAAFSHSPRTASANLAPRRRQGKDPCRVPLQVISATEKVGRQPLGPKNRPFIGIQWISTSQKQMLQSVHCARHCARQPIATAPPAFRTEWKVEEPSARIGSVSADFRAWDA